MIYLFGKGREFSIIYDDNTLTEQDKIGGIAVEQLPPEENKEGYNAILCIGDNNQLYYEYEKIEKETPQE
jgi:hypothetical protein